MPTAGPFYAIYTNKPATILYLSHTLNKQLPFRFFLVLPQDQILYSYHYRATSYLLSTTQSFTDILLSNGRRDDTTYEERNRVRQFQDIKEFLDAASKHREGTIEGTSRELCIIN
jgi:hypothetical protein